MSKMNESAFGQMIAGIFYQVQRQGPVPELEESERLDGKTCLITGANTGLGKGIAVEYARRGARVIMACRGGIPEAGEDVRRESGSDHVEMLPVDLSDFASIHALCDELLKREVRLDAIVLNAAVVPLKSKPTTQGFELMFGVNYLANVLLLGRLLTDGVIPNRSFAKIPQDTQSSDALPRIIFVSSEDHRRAEHIRFERFGEFYEYKGMGDMAQYGNTKLMLTTYAQELARRLRDEQGVDVSVYTFCPGAVRSDIARDAPWYARILLGPVMRFCFASPEKAAAPALYFAASRKMEGRTGVYFKRMMEIPPVDEALDAKVARRLWRESEVLLAAAQVTPR